MKSFIIAWKDFTIQLRDRKAFLLMIFMPLLLTMILGAALKGVFNEDANVPDTIVAVYQEDTDSLSEKFISDVLKGNDFKEFLTVKKADSQTQIEEMIKSRKVDIGIVLPEKWSEGLAEGELAAVKIVADPSKELQTSIMETIVGTFTDRVTAVSRTTTAVVTDLSSARPVSSEAVDVQQLASQVVSQLEDEANKDTLALIEEVPLGKKSVSSMQYYAAAMAAMFLLFNMTFGAKSIIIERTTETLSRLMSTPTTNLTILFGKFLGVLYFALSQLTIFIAVTHFVFGVNWGNNLAQTAVIGVSYAIAVSGLAILIAAILTSEKTADVVGGMAVQMLALLGGSMLPLSLFPDSLQLLANIAPNKWALTSFLNVMGGTDWDTLLTAIVTLVAIGLGSVTIGAFRLKVR